MSDLNTTTNVKDIKILMSALKWRYMSRDHECLMTLDIFNSLHKKSPKLKSLWGKPVAVEIGFDGSNLANEMLDLFDMLYMTILRRIVESDIGSQNKLEGNSMKITRAKSIIRQSSVSPLFQSVFNIIFSETRRYIDILEKSKGIDWAIYAKQRDEHKDLLTLEKPEGKDSVTPDHDDILLLDEELATPPVLIKKDSSKSMDEKKEDGDQIDTAVKMKEERAIREMRQILKLYSESFLKRLLRLVEVFTSIAALEYDGDESVLKNTQGSMIKKLLEEVASPD